MKWHHLQAYRPDGSLARYSSPRKTDANKIERFWREQGYTEIARWFGR